MTKEKRIEKRLLCAMRVCICAIVILACALCIVVVKGHANTTEITEDRPKTEYEMTLDQLVKSGSLKRAQNIRIYPANGK